MRARVDDELSVAAEDPLTASQRMLDQLGSREILPKVRGL